MTRCWLPISFAAWLWFAVALAGCGKTSTLERLPIFGSVSLASDEKVNGSITFLPAEGRSGPAATISMVEGRYQFNRENGPTAGPNRVVVSRALAKGALTLQMVREKMANEKAAADKAAKAKSAAEKAAIQKASAADAAAYAKQFRTDWTFFVDVQPDKSYEHDFTLEP